MRSFTKALSMSAFLMVSGFLFTSNANAAPPCTSSFCKNTGNGAQCVATGGAIKTCGQCLGGSTSVLYSGDLSPEQAEHLCKCQHDRTYNDGCPNQVKGDSSAKKKAARAEREGMNAGALLKAAAKTQAGQKGSKRPSPKAKGPGPKAKAGSKGKPAANQNSQGGNNGTQAITPKPPKKTPKWKPIEGARYCGSHCNKAKMKGVCRNACFTAVGMCNKQCKSHKCFDSCVFKFTRKYR
jgi:hypothetical protein